MAEQQPSIMSELKAVYREGREDLANAVLRAMPDSMHLTRELGAPDMPALQAPEAGFQSVLAEYASRGDGKEQQAEQGLER